MSQIVKRSKYKRLVTCDDMISCYEYVEEIERYIKDIITTGRTNIKFKSLKGLINMKIRTSLETEIVSYIKNRINGYQTNIRIIPRFVLINATKFAYYFDKYCKDIIYDNIVNYIRYNNSSVIKDISYYNNIIASSYLIETIEKFIISIINDSNEVKIHVPYFI